MSKSHPPVNQYIIDYIDDWRHYRYPAGNGMAEFIKSRPRFLLEPIQKMPTLTPEQAKQLKDKALENVFKCLPIGSYVFGGCVRDPIAGKEFKDIDIFFPTLMAYNIFSQKMADLGYSTRLEREGKYVKKCHHEVRTLFAGRASEYTKTNVCQLDCVIGDGLKSGHMDPDEWDADVNAIAQGPDKKIFSLVGASPSNLAEVINHIKNNTFRSLPGMTEFRKNKLLKKGYKEIIMSSPKPQSEELSFWENFKQEEAPEIAYRVTANQLVKTTKQCALLGIQAKGGNSETVKTMTELMNTEAGDVAISGMLMLLCMYTPQLNQNPKVKRLAKEFRVSGVATGANALLDVARELLLPGLLEALKKLPEVTEEKSAQVRVEDSAPKQLFEDKREEEEQPAPALKMAVSR